MSGPDATRTYVLPGRSGRRSPRTPTAPLRGSAGRSQPVRPL